MAEARHFRQVVLQDITVFYDGREVQVSWDVHTKPEDCVGSDGSSPVAGHSPQGVSDSAESADTQVP